MSQEEQNAHMLWHGRRRGRRRRSLRWPIVDGRYGRAVKRRVQGPHGQAGWGHPPRAGDTWQQRVARARGLAGHGQAEVAARPEG